MANLFHLINKINFLKAYNLPLILPHYQYYRDPQIYSMPRHGQTWRGPSSTQHAPPSFNFSENWVTKTSLIPFHVSHIRCIFDDMAGKSCRITDGMPGWFVYLTVSSSNLYFLSPTAALPWGKGRGTTLAYGKLYGFLGSNSNSPLFLTLYNLMRTKARFLSNSHRFSSNVKISHYRASQFSQFSLACLWP